MDFAQMSSLALLGILLIASAVDLRERRIPNLLIGVGLLFALVASIADGGWKGGAGCVLGGAAGLALLLPFFMLRMVGAGDAKLMAVVGSFVGLSALAPVALYTFLAGGLFAAIACLYRGSLGATIGNIKLLVVSVALRMRGMPLALQSAGDESLLRLPYSLAIATGVVLWMFTR